MKHRYYSIRTGKNPNVNGLPFDQFKDVFLRLYQNLRGTGYFDEYLGWSCVDMGDVSGKISDVELEIMLKIRKRDLWPIEQFIEKYEEDDLFDIIEFLFQGVSKPIEGSYPSYGDCGMHWETFNRKQGQDDFREKMNEILSLYETPYELSDKGEVLHKPEKGFEQIFEADVPTPDSNIKSRVDSAIVKYRRHGATVDDRRQAVRDLADVLEYLRPKVKELLIKQDEKDLFNIANNFGIRHHNEQQKTSYDTSLWLSWMFYFYLSTIHVVLRKIGNTQFRR